ncbi:hypothetical protein B0J17DRAFT_663809 [Rhizoctonia solani]|nr:hypothetical protein B0J17DRAFT_663809 [Rhizoctonia solani]
MIPMTIQYFIWKKWPTFGPVGLDKLTLLVVHMLRIYYLTNGRLVLLTLTPARFRPGSIWSRRRSLSLGFFPKFDYVVGIRAGATSTTIFSVVDWMEVPRRLYSC